jgi:hypothetical protein
MEKTIATKDVQAQTPDAPTEKPTAKSIVDQLFKERDGYQQANLTQRSTFDEIYSAYVGEIEDNTDKSKSQEKIMKLRTEVNYIVPSIFSGQPEIEVEPIGEEDKDLAYVGEKIINYRLNSIPQAYEKIEAWVKQAVVFGTSVMRVCWTTELTENEDGTQGVATDEPSLIVDNIKDCFYNPIISEIESQNSFIIRSVSPINEVKESTMYDFVDDMGVENRTKIEVKGNTATTQFDSSKQNATDRFDSTKVADGTVEVYERITEDRIQTVADGKERLVLRDVANPIGFINAVKLIHEPTAIPNRFEGYGVGHNTLGYSRMIQKLSNKLLDMVNMGNNPHFLGRKGAGIDKRQLVIKAGGLTEVEGDGPLQDQIQPLQVPDIKNGALELRNHLEDEHKRASGANDMMQGAASNKTLGQDQMASTYSASRFELINRRFKQALADVGRMLLMMEIQYIQSMDAPILKIFPLEAEVVNGKILYSRETVYQMLIAARDRKDLNFNIQVKGETNISRNKDVQMKQFVDIFNLCSPMLPPQYQMEWIKKMLQLRGIDEIDKLIPDAEAMQQPQVDPNTGQPIQNPNGQPVDPQMLAQGGMDGQQMQPQVM